jgi:LCP family protein required for cell wall assembly
MQLCSNCSAPLPDGARFCGKCGWIADGAPAASSPPAPQPTDFTVDNDYPIKRHARQPYRYNPLPENSNDARSQLYGQANPYTQNAPANQPQSTGRAPNQPAASWQPGTYSSSPANSPNRLILPEAQPYPAAPAPNAPAPVRGPKPARPRRRRGCMIGCLGVLVALIILGVILVPMAQRVLAFGSAISTQSPLSTQTGYMSTSDRVNILVMGYGGAGHDGAYLTDSMVIMSLIPSTHHTTLISVPRDLWVQYPAIGGSVSCNNNCMKLNAVYATAAGANNTDPVAGGNAAAQEVSLITGLQVNYWMTINFAGFKDFINAIGGVDVNVPDSFNACYPANDDPSINASWIVIQFNKGMQHMDGTRAIEYARAREPVEVCSKGTSENQAELSDFARSQRQQLIMQAALSKLKDWHNWLSLYNALGALQKTLYTNLSLADLGEFALHMDLKNAHRLGLSNQNVLIDSSLSDGTYILVPGNGGWQAIQTYVKNGLYN